MEEELMYMNLKIKEKHRNLFHEELYICYDFYQENDLLCGDGYIYIGTKNIDQFGNLGYYIHEEYRNQGYATQACCRLMDVLIEQKVNPLYMIIDEDNIYSNKLCQNLGFSLISKIEKEDNEGIAYKNKYILFIN